MKYKKIAPEKRPLWIVPVEVIKPFSEYKGEDWFKIYAVEMEGENIKLKAEGITFKYGWLQYGQIKDLFETDKKKYGFSKKNSELEVLLLGEMTKLISKLYKLLLTVEMVYGRQSNQSANGNLGNEL